MNMNDNRINDYNYEEDPFADNQNHYTKATYKKSFTNSLLEKDKKSLEKLARKIRGIFLIIWGPICMLLIASIFIFPKYFQDTTPTEYYISGQMVTKEEFYSSPEPLYFMPFCLVPTILGIVELVKANKE